MWWQRVQALFTMQAGLEKKEKFHTVTDAANNTTTFDYFDFHIPAERTKVTNALSKDTE